MFKMLDTRRPLIVQNKDKSCVGFIEKESNEALYLEIAQAIQDKGWNGFKAFFYAIIEKSSETKTDGIVIKINPKRVLPVESW